MARRIIIKLSYWTGLPLLFSLILILLWFFINFYEDSNYYINYNQFKSKNVYIDSLVINGDEDGGATIWGIKILENKLLKVSHGHLNWSYHLTKDPIVEIYKKNNKHLNIWYWEKSDKAYFVEPGLEEMSFETVWLPDLKRLSIVLLIYLFHAYCQHTRKKYEFENLNIKNHEN